MLRNSAEPDAGIKTGAAFAYKAKKKAAKSATRFLNSAYADLIRLRRPEPIFLLFLPCLWALAAFAPFPFLFAQYSGVFLLGAFLTRSAGCIINDMADKELDAGADRTKYRPLAAGRLNRAQALALLIPLGLAAAALLPLLPAGAAYIAVAAACLTVLYPFSKRFFPLPQLVLALTFNAGVLMAGFASPEYPLAGVSLLYAAAAFWTFGYDTVYALPDKEADEKMHMFSAPLTLGKYTMPAVWGCYAAMHGCIALFLLYYSAHAAAWICLAASAAVSAALLTAAVKKESFPSFFRLNLIPGLLLALCCAAARFL